MRIQLSLISQPSTDLYAVIEHLRRAGIHAVGGADLGDLKAIIVRPPGDADLAIALLKKMRIDAQRG